MANRGFNSVFVLIAVCIWAELDVAMLQNPPSSKYPGYYKQNEKGDFAIRMVFAEDVLGVHIYFDSQTDSAKPFFESQITPKITDGLASCKEVKFFFHPCSISMINDKNTLVCPKEPNQCDTNKYQSCVVNKYGFQDNAVTIKFLTCNFSGKTTDECSKECKMDGDSLKGCAGSSIGDSYCNDSYGTFDLIKKKPVEAEVANAGKYPDPFTKFGDVLCQAIKETSLKCTNICN